VTTPLIAIGWTLSTPVYDHVKRLLWRNREALPIRGIAFERRLVDDLHGIPILELPELLARPDADTTAHVILTVNAQVIAAARAALGARGIPVLEPDAWLRGLAATPRWAELVSPFPTIPLAAFGRPRASEAVARRRELHARLAGVFERIDLAGFYGPTEHITEDMFFADVLHGYFRGGTRDFVLAADDASLATDILLQLAPTYTAGEVAVAVRTENALGPRTELYRSVLGDRLRTSLPAGPFAGCIVADSLSAFLSQAERASGAHAVVRLRGSVCDVEELARALDDRTLPHRITLRQISVEPTQLYAMLAP
jgi:hypothetical protein